MVKQSDEFGALVRSILADRRLALTALAEQSNGRISYGTVRAMAQRGIVPGPELIVEFARAAQAEERVNELLDAAGIWYLRYNPMPERVRRGAARLTASRSQQARGGSALSGAV